MSETEQEQARQEIERRAEAFRGAVEIILDRVAEDERDPDLRDALSGLTRLRELLTPLVPPQWR